MKSWELPIRHHPIIAFARTLIILVVRNGIEPGKQEDGSKNCNK